MIGECSYSSRCRCYWKADPNCHNTDGGDCKLPEDYIIMESLGARITKDRIIRAENVREICSSINASEFCDDSFYLNQRLNGGQVKPDGVNQ